MPHGQTRYTSRVLRSFLDTICGVATPPGIGGIAVIRVSGSSAFELCDRVLRQKRRNSDYTGFTLHRAAVVECDEVVDDVLVAVFHGPRSFTGEDVIEISCHGGRIPVSRTISLLLQAGCRAAGAGEFTQRAFYNGKLDLVQAEAICDLIDAKTGEAFRQAQSNLLGKLSQVVEKIRFRLLGVLARIEASIDFPEDVGELDVPACVEELLGIDLEIQKLLSSAARGIVLREGAKVVLVGRPNAGKSSLLNALLRHDRAIVTDIPGTTRDTLEETLNLHGVAVRLWDTAGLRITDDPIESIGVTRSRNAAQSADLVLMVVDSTVGITEEDRETIAGIEPERCLVVWNKCDLNSVGDLQVSAATGAGIDELEERMANYILGPAASDEPSQAALSHTHQRDAVQRALASVGNALASAEDAMPADFLSIDVRAALTALGELTGETASDDIINEIFSRFCIGK